MNNNKCLCECKNPKEHRVYEKDYIWNPATCSCKNGKYLANIIDDSVITFDETIDVEATQPAYNVSRMPPNSPILFETSQTIMGPK